MCRIAEVLISLQQAGNVKYTDWVLSFSCVMDSYEGLQQLARQMETELQEWKDEVKKAREVFYEFNYYRALQLLSLRSELGKLKAFSRDIDSPAVLALLHSISPQIALSNITEVIKKVPTLLQQRGALSQTDASDVPPLFDVPAAKPTQEDLSDKQKEVFANLVGYHGFHPQLALIALEKYKEDFYELFNWCLNNASSYHFPEEVEKGDKRTGDQELESDELESEDEHFSTPIGKLLFHYYVLHSY